MTAAIDDRAEWLAWRKIGASDIAAMVHGIYGGQYAVVANLLGHDTELGDNLDEKHRGLAWETRIADAVQALSGMYVIGEQARITHRDHPHHTATVDGFLAWVSEASIADVAALLEIKTVHEFADMHWDRWATQVRWQMHCADVDRALIVAVKMDTITVPGPGGDEIEVETFGGLYRRWVDRDLELEADLADLADETWAHVQAGALPDPDCPSALPYVRKLTAIADTAKKPAPVDLDSIAGQVERFGLIKAAKKAAEDEHSQLYSLIAHRLGPDRAGVTTSGWRVSFSAPSKQIDEAALLAMYPWCTKPVFDRAAAEQILGKKAVEAFKAPTGHRTLTIKPPKEPTP